jgi:hypothetical protein
MTEPRDGSAQGRALWQRWSTMEKAANGKGPDSVARPEIMVLAEFAENRLSGPEAAAIEAFLAANPLIAQDVAAASRDVEIPPRAGDTALAVAIARAAALVPAQGGAADRGRRGDNIVPFRAARPAGSAWPIAARWGALAASLALISWLGFALGSDAYGDLAALNGQAGTRLADELLDPPSGFFGLVDQSGT